MRYDPLPPGKRLKKNDPERIKAITRKVALWVALLGVYFFFIKLLFL